jgi:hypothetical protein
MCLSPLIPERVAHAALLSSPWPMWKGPNRRSPHWMGRTLRAAPSRSMKHAPRSPVRVAGEAAAATVAEEEEVVVVAAEVGEIAVEIAANVANPAAAGSNSQVFLGAARHSRNVLATAPSQRAGRASPALLDAFPLTNLGKRFDPRGDQPLFLAIPQSNVYDRGAACVIRSQLR